MLPHLHLLWAEKSDENRRLQVADELTLQTRGPVTAVTSGNSLIVYNQKYKQVLV